MTTVDRVVSRVVLGTLAPAGLLLIGWWGSFALLGDSAWIAACALGGLSAGIVLDLTMLRKHLDSLYELSNIALAMIAVFYSVMIYGFFMGFPVFNVMVGVGWGFVLGRRHRMRGIVGRPDGADVHSAALTVAGITFVLCCATAWLAFGEVTIASEVRGMLGLPFTPTMGMLRAAALLGGCGLVGAGHALTCATARWAGASGSA